MCSRRFLLIFLFPLLAHAQIFNTAFWKKAAAVLIPNSWTVMNETIPHGLVGSGIVQWTGTKVLVASATMGSYYDPSTDSWGPRLSYSNAPVGVSNGRSFVWANGKLIAWGGYAFLVWTGTQMAAWGGYGYGGLYTP